MTTREVRAALGSLSQQRVSQLVREGILVVDHDANGVLQYDRATVESLASERASKHSRNSANAEERRALRDEANDRFKRQRERERLAEAERIARLDDWRERATIALEGIAKCLSSRK